MGQHPFDAIRFFTYILQKEHLSGCIDFVRRTQGCNNHRKTAPQHCSPRFAGSNNLTDFNLPHPFFPRQSSPQMVSAARGQSTCEVHGHHRRMKRHHAATLQKPVQETCDVAVAGKNFRVRSDALSQMRNKLDGAKTPTSTEDCVEVRSAKRPFKVAGPLLIVPRQIAFAIMYSRSKLDLEPVLLQSLNASRQ